MLKSARSTEFQTFWGEPPPASVGTPHCMSCKPGRFGFEVATASNGPPVPPAIPCATICPTVKVWVGTAPERSFPKVLKNAPVVAGSDAAISWGVGTQFRTFELLRTRVHSVLLKKNSLSFTTGPPIE